MTQAISKSKDTLILLFERPIEIIASFIMASSVIAMPNRLEKDKNSHLLQTFEA